MPVVKIDDIPDRDGRKARRLLFICRDCDFIGYVAVRRELYNYVCQECQGKDWVAIHGTITVVQVPPKQ